MKKLLIGLVMAATAAPALVATPAAAQTQRQIDREYRQDIRQAQRERRQAIRDWRQSRRYDFNRFERGQDRYYADRYYRDGRYYRERRLSRNDRIYRGYDGRYYCRRNDGTTGLILGAAVGGLLGNAIDGGRSSLLGTLIGAGAGAALGREVERGQVRCR